MAEKIIEYYNVVQKAGGLQASIRLAMLTKISAVKAKNLPDSMDNIALFEKAIKEIFGVDFRTLKLKGKK